MIAAVALPLFDLVLGVSTPILPQRPPDVILSVGKLALVVSADIPLIVAVRIDELSVVCHVGLRFGNDHIRRTRRAASTGIDVADRIPGPP